ncbi:hypothetical protein M8J76_006365 [Diaphorina citri]|nr:hypothetical protein M8J76_006365 [Diaphorina citri]
MLLRTRTQVFENKAIKTQENNSWDSQNQGNFSSNNQEDFGSNNQGNINSNTQEKIGSNNQNQRSQNQRTISSNTQEKIGPNNQIGSLQKELNTSSNNQHFGFEGRGPKTDPWKLIVPLIFGFHFSGIVAAAAHVIKLFIVQAFFASKIALLIGAYIVLQKLIQLNSMKTVHKVLVDEPYYDYNSVKTVHKHKSLVEEPYYDHAMPPHGPPMPPVTAYHAPHAAYGPQHSSGELHFEDYASLLPSEAEGHAYPSYGAYPEAQSHYPENPTHGGPAGGATYEQAPAILAHHEYSIHEPQFDNSQQASESNLSSPINVVTTDSLVSRPLIRRRFKV